MMDNKLNYDNSHKQNKDSITECKSKEILPNNGKVVKQIVKISNH